MKSCNDFSEIWAFVSRLQLQYCTFAFSGLWDTRRSGPDSQSSTDWTELLSHAVKGGANKTPANRTLSLAFGPPPFIKNSCYLKSLYPQHFFLLFEDDFSLPSTGSRLFHQRPRAVSWESDLFCRHTVVVAVMKFFWMSMKCRLVSCCFFSFDAFQMLLVKALTHCSLLLHDAQFYSLMSHWTTAQTFAVMWLWRWENPVQEQAQRRLGRSFTDGALPCSDRSRTQVHHGHLLPF